jgi:hypothetical protein
MAKKRKRRKKSSAEKSLALIAAGGTISAALIAGAVKLIVELRKEPSTARPTEVVSPLADPKVVPIPFWLDLQEPVAVWPKKLGSKYGFTSLPKIQFEGTCSDYLQKDALSVQCDKAWLTGSSSLEEVGGQHIEIDQKADSRRLVATFDSGSFIRSSQPHSQTPHGPYRVLFKLTVPRQPKSSYKGFPFNYVYEESFKQLSEVLDTNDREFVSIPGPQGGLEMQVLAGKRRVSAHLTQEFDFKTNFCVLGCFTAEFEDAGDPTSLDIVVCDGWGEKLSVVFADGRLDTFSIKTAQDRRGEKDVTIARARTSVGRTTDEETVYNFFEIRVQKYGDKAKCSLFLRHNGAIRKGDPPIHWRMLENLEFLTDLTHINLKLRKPGTVRLYDFEVARLPSGSAGS